MLDIFRNRKTLTVITIVSALLLMLTGTFAYNQAINKTNEFIGHKGNVTLHDDFAEPKKEIYVENTGSSAMYVRVMLDEAMDLTSNVWRATAAGDWESHIYGTTEDDCGNANSAGALFHDYFTWIMGGQKWYMPADGSSQVVGDTTVYTAADEVNGAKQTPAAEIIKASDYILKSPAEQKLFYGWIYDTDGYAYWSRPLAKDEATGLLLKTVNTAQSIKGTDYYYAINVKVEAVDDDDLPMWTQGAAASDGSGETYSEATATGKQVLEFIANLIVKDAV